MAVNVHLQFRRATLEDASMLLGWRNDPASRQGAIQTGNISWETHLQWLTASLQNPHRQIYVVTRKGEPIGTLRGELREGYTELSWIIDPAARGQGLGTEMLRQGCSLFAGKLQAQIKKNNTASLKMAQNVGFYQLKEEGELSHWAFTPPGSPVDPLKPSAGY